MPMVMAIQNTIKTESRRREMDNYEKQKVIKSIVPKAVLKALTDGSKYAITKKSYELDVIPIYNYPFKIGREARVEHVNGETIVKERHKLDASMPSNDAYLVDNGKLLQISRRHCVIAMENDSYKLKDRGSACGCMVNDVKIGNELDDNCGLEDGDIITLGSHNSNYKYQFITLDF